MDKTEREREKLVGQKEGLRERKRGIRRNERKKVVPNKIHQAMRKW